ncbi:hypothetical protein ACFIQF_02775 [Comamonas sp. J-3]|uniref:hypothetical protein n=1 Tax=Comamonas trifloxystrobinivorans TaxID=3350256 RepID=UPI003728985E
MYLLLIGWLYVVLMMAVVEAASPQGTLLGAFFTLLLYGVLPLGLLLFIGGTPARRRARHRAEQKEQARQAPAATQASAGPPTATTPPAAPPET